ncbi:hypothetical protein KI387_041092, partial [Taxus chinensis]
VLDLIKERLEVNASALPDDWKDCIAHILRKCEPPACPLCRSSQDCIFRYLNNKKVARSIQPRFLCRKCRKHFTVGTRKSNLDQISINRKRKASFIEMPIAAEYRANCPQGACWRCISSCPPQLSDQDYHLTTSWADPEGIVIGTHIYDDDFMVDNQFTICDSNPFLTESATPSIDEYFTVPGMDDEPTEPFLQKNIIPGLYDAADQSRTENEESSLGTCAVMEKCEEDEGHGLLEETTTTSEYIDCFGAEEIGLALQNLIKRSGLSFESGEF